MKKIKNFMNKNIVVLGLGKTGFNVAKTLKELGANVIVNDLNTPTNLDEIHILENNNITVITGSHPDNLIDDNIDMLFKNPGIPYTNPVVQQAIRKGIPIFTDVELAYLIAQAPIISITGSNGKTTTTTLIYEMLKNKNAKLAGNIGISSVQVAKNANPKDLIIMEMSSFQLKGVQKFTPNIAVITNIYDNHLDYHKTREDYLNSKLNLIKNLTQEHFLILNGDLKESYTFESLTKAKVLYFSTQKQLDAYVKDDKIYIFDEYIMDVANIKVPGIHNIENVLAAILVAKILNQSNEMIQKTVSSFHGVKHRTQYVGEKNGIKFYNDSKATNILATTMALKGFKNKVILIAGGLDRGNGFETLEQPLEKVKTIVVYGQTKEKIAQTAEKVGVKKIIIVDTLEEAVSKAYQSAKFGDDILFSPACASWDQFESFEVRGDKFIEAFNNL